MSTDILDRTDEDTTTTDNDNPLHSHYFRRRDLQEAVATGKPIVALCGYKKQPDRDGEGLPICQTCAEIYKGIRE